MTTKIRPNQIQQYGATTGQAIVWDGTKWAPATPSGYTDPLTTKGDLVGRSSSATVRVPVGTNGQVLESDSTATAGVRWVTPAAVPTRASDLTTVIVPLTTAVAGTPDLVWDSNNNLVLVEVAYP